MRQIKALEKKMGYKFKDRGLLVTALTHSSYANENKRSGCKSNERLEFLGDSILGMTVAEHLYKSYDHMPEGKMTRLRAELVCEQSLYESALKLGLGKHLRLGKGEEQTGGRERPSILADAVEAVIAAVFLDGGSESASEIVHRYILASLESGEKVDNSDYKTALQELIQKTAGQVLEYTLLGTSGPDHDPVFSSRVSLNGEPVGEGVGRSKKEAEQMAAKAALEGLRE